MRTTKKLRGQRRAQPSGQSKRARHGNDWFRKLRVEGLELRRLLSVDVLTWHNDLTRDGLNSNEVSLTPANVNAGTFGELLSYPVDGQVYAQPLYVSKLAIPGLGTVNVVFVATENNDVYAFNADSNAGANGGLIWHVNLGLAAATPNNYFANRYGPYHDINPEVGITSTPVINLSTDTMYLDAFTNDVAGQNVYSHHIHALNILTGQDEVAPMLVSASVAGNGVEGNGTTVTFDAEQQLQRPALTLLNGVLYVAYGSYADSDPYHGWILGFNPTTLQLVSIFNDSPNLISTPASSTADEAGIWQSGAGLASDGTNLFFMTANGDFSTPVSTYGDYGDTILKVVPDSSTSANPNINGYGMHAVDYFTPYNQLALSNADEDLGSGGAMLLPTQPGPYPDELVGSGKQGTVYLVNRDDMGQYSPTTDNVIQEVSLGHGNWDSPAYFNEAVYYHAVGDVLKRYTLTNGLLSPAPADESTIAYESGYGATPSISSDGTANGIVWDVDYDSSHQVLYAYDATTLTELYGSNQDPSRDQMGAGVKFITPTIADGEVFVGSSGALTIYGLLTPPTTPPAAPTNLTAAAVSATSITLNWVNNATNQSGFLIDRSTGNASNFTQIAVASVGALSYTDTTANPGTLYYYEVQATNVIGNSAFTNTASATTPELTGAVDVYHFDEGSGTTTADSVGGNNGTLIGSPLPQRVTPGKIGTAALSFSGDGTYDQTASESAVQVTSDLSPILGSTSSLDVWVKTTQVGNDTHWMAPAITGVEQTGAGNDINWGTINASGDIGIYVGDSGGVYSTMPLNDGQWHNIAITRDATTGIVQLYVDGVLNGSATLDTGGKTSQFFLIGALSVVAMNGTTYMGANYFNGTLDEVRIYNQVLDANDIEGLALIPPVPTLTSVTAASGSVVQLAWSAPTSYTQYIEVDRKAGANGTYAAVATLGGGTTSFMDQNLTGGVTYYYEIKAIDLAGTSPASNALSATTPVPTIVANRIFYNNSTFDGYNGSSNITDDNAIATDKVALLPGQAASFANITSYSKGINGIIIDVANLNTIPTADDFDFQVGNNDDVDSWADAPDPTIVNAYPGRGPGGSTQITIIWPDNSIENEWLQVTMLADQVTGLAEDDVFYFGNAIGLTGASTTNAQVTSADAARVAANFTSKASVTDPYDINRDGVVDANDVALVNANLTTAADALNLISLTPPTVATLASASPSYVTGGATTLRVLGADIGGESLLTYTWSTIGTPPAAVTFSDNGTNTAKNTTTTFTRAGFYNFLVTISDQGGSTVTNDVSVLVAQTLSSIVVTAAPAPAIVGGTTQQFSAAGLDQFSQPMTVSLSPVWSVVSGGGSITSSGLYTSPEANGSATIQAASGAASGTMNVTYFGQAEWNSSVSASWNTSGNWKDAGTGTSIAAPGVRGIAGDTVLFAAGNGSTARLDGASPTLAGITFDNAATGYKIVQGTGAGSVTLQGAGGATVSVLAGSHAIAAPLHLSSNTSFSITANSSLAVSGGVDGSGSLTLSGGGALLVSGPASYTGGTSVTGGTLVVLSAAALPEGASLFVGNGSSSLFSTAVVAPGPQVSPAASPTPAAASSAAVTATSAVDSALASVNVWRPVSKQAWLPAVPRNEQRQRQETGRMMN
jgi:autotransporter-associated beta strand protein